MDVSQIVTQNIFENIQYTHTYYSMNIFYDKNYNLFYHKYNYMILVIILVNCQPYYIKECIYIYLRKWST